MEDWFSNRDSAGHRYSKKKKETKQWSVRSLYILELLTWANKTMYCWIQNTLKHENVLRETLREAGGGKLMQAYIPFKTWMCFNVQINRNPSVSNSSGFTVRADLIQLKSSRLCLKNSVDKRTAVSFCNPICTVSCNTRPRCCSVITDSSKLREFVERATLKCAANLGCSRLDWIQFHWYWYYR
jgi:hypothetical protein